MTSFLSSCQEADKSSTKDKLDSLIIVNSHPADTTSTRPQISVAKPTILVLPPFDEMAGAGISPDIQKYIEQVISKDTGLTLIPFPLKKLMQEPYSNVYDKKFCQGILKVVPCDFMIMSRLEYKKRTGYMEKDEWKFNIKIYDVKSGKQFSSKLTADNSTDSLIRLCITKSNLTTEMKNSH